MCRMRDETHLIARTRWPTCGGARGQTKGSSRRQVAPSQSAALGAPGRELIGALISLETFEPPLVGKKYRRTPRNPELVLVYNVIPTIDIKGFACDKLCPIVREESGRDADVVDADEAASRSL